ncbi:MAG: efflux RND transporter periplasmic adaptor subunit [Rhodothermales bacterium]|nr:efflux RND transporter periplasmic adaptor subunit [Rhodothermales bacterium]
MPLKSQRLLLSAVLALFLLSGCGSEGEGAVPEETATPAAPASNQRVVRVDTEVLQPTDFEDVVQITGVIEAPNDATLSAQAGGTLEYLAPLGQRVRRGAVVARLDSDLLSAGLRQAEALLEVQKAQENLASDNFARQEPLYRDSIISALEFESVRTQLIQAQAQRSQAESAVAQATKSLANTRITAPFGGTIEQHFADSGEQIVPGAAVLRLVNTSRVRIVAGVPERYASDIEVGAAVTAAFSAYGMEPVTGQVAFVGQVINPQSRTFRVEVELPNPDGALKPEMIANLQLTRDVRTNQLVIPLTSVLREEDKSSVFVVTSPGDGTVQMAERRTVTMGPSYGGRVVVEAGLQAGDEIIVAGQTNVTEGDAVEIANRTSTR